MEAFAIGSNGVSLGELFSRKRIIGGRDIRVHSICHDWRQCAEGDLFVALTSADGDSHHDAMQAVERGAAAVLVEHLLPLSVPQCVVPDTREAYAKLCMELVGRPDQKLTTIGITGTGGKTSTALLLANILTAAGETSNILHDPDIRGGGSSPYGRTTACQASIADHLRSISQEGGGHAILEATSRALAERQLAGVQFDLAVITNIRRDHLDLHRNAINYRRAKARLLEQLKDDGLIIVNADDRYACRMADETLFPAIRFGIHQEAHLRATILERHPSTQTFLLEFGDEAHPITTSMIGDLHVSNCLAAAASAIALGVDIKTIVRGLEHITALPRRLERLECGQPYSIYLDTADTPESLAATVKSIASVATGKTWCLYGPSFDRDPSQRPTLGRVAEQYADQAIITRCGTDRSPPDMPFDAAHDILDGYRRPAKGHVLPTRLSAIQWTFDQAKQGDAILIAGCVDPLNESKAAESERTAIRELLYKQANQPSAQNSAMRFPAVSAN